MGLRQPFLPSFLPAREASHLNKVCFELAYYINGLGAFGPLDDWPVIQVNDWHKMLVDKKEAEAKANKTK